jgi:hypothetical protein
MEAPLEAGCSDDESQALIREVTEIDCDILQHAEHPGSWCSVQLLHVGLRKITRFVQQEPRERKTGASQSRFGAPPCDVVERAGCRCRASPSQDAMTRRSRCSNSAGAKGLVT